MDKKLYFVNNGKPLCIWKQWDQDAVMQNLSTIFGEPFNKESFTDPYDVMDRILYILATKEFGIVDDVIFNLGLKYKFENNLISETFIPEIYKGGYNSGYTDWWEGQQEVYLNWVCTIELVESLMSNICLAYHLGNKSIRPYTEIFPRREHGNDQYSLGADLSREDDFCAFTFLFPLNNGMFGERDKE